ncbi:MAG TPA: hypothetical protein VMW65_15890, partial [Chloroflexota bacterium]|nr:hypothetical protein [Chloroflexota bacterium]
LRDFHIFHQMPRLMGWVCHFFCYRQGIWTLAAFNCATVFMQQADCGDGRRVVTLRSGGLR